MRRASAIGLVGVAIATLLLGLMIRQASRIEHISGVPYVRGFEDPSNGVEVLLGIGDGQAFAGLARDPTLSHPEIFRGGPADAAYRAQRPVLVYVAWALGAGDPDRVSLALVLASVIGAGLAAASCAGLLRARHALPALGIAVLLMPGAVAAIRGLSSEVLGLALTGLGILLWERRKTAGAIVLFAVAGLARETLLLVPFVLAILSFRRHEREAKYLVSLPIATYLAWAFVVTIRFGTSPFLSEGRLDWPLVGLVRGLPDWSSPVTSGFVLGLGVIVVVVLLALRPRDDLTIVALSYAAFGLVMGELVWRQWQDFSRPLLPLYAFGLIALLGNARPVRQARPSSRLSAP